MHPIDAPRFRILAFVSMLALAVAAVGCGDPSPEEQLAEATQELAAAAQAKEGAKTALDQLEQRLADAQAARDKAAEAYDESVERWRNAKDAVGQFATDEVLHQQVNRALLDAGELRDATITARVHQRSVTLIGEASSQDDVETAKTLAEEIPGVARVTSQVVLESPSKSQTAPPPAEPKSLTPAAKKPVPAPPPGTGSETEPPIEPFDEPAASTLEPGRQGDPSVPGKAEPEVRERQI